MLSEKILGNINDERFKDLKKDYVDIEWHEAFKKLHKKITRGGKEIGIRLDDSILKKGLRCGDVLFADENEAVVINIPPCNIIEINIEPSHSHSCPKVCYEIGNRHAPLFFGENDLQFITVYNEPLFEMLSKIHGVSAEKKSAVLDFDKRISASVHNHTH